MGSLALTILEILGMLLVVMAILGVLIFLTTVVPWLYYLGSAIAGGIIGVVIAPEDSSAIGEFFGGALVLFVVAALVHGWLLNNITSDSKGKKSSSSGVSRQEMQNYVRNQNADNIWFNAGFFGGLNKQNQKNVQDAYRRGYDDGYFDND